MKRGFLNAPRSMRTREEVPKAGASQLGPSPQAKSKTSPPSLRADTQDEHEGAAHAEDAMDVDTTPVGSGDVSNAGSRVVAVRTTRGLVTDTKGKMELDVLGDDDNGTNSEPPPMAPIEGEGEGTLVDMDDDGMDTLSDDAPFFSFLPPRPPPRRPGWGRDPEEDIFHTVPPSHGGPHRKRAVFRVWPRDPNGKVLMPSEEPRGTLSPGGYPWGATLYDFYHVNRLPSANYHMNTVMSGSAICEALEALGELDTAVPEMEWAESEGKPRVEGVADTGELIQSIERRSQLRIYHNFSMRETQIERDHENEESSGDAEEGQKDGKQDNESAVEQAPEGDDDDGRESADEDYDEEDEEVSAYVDEAEEQAEIPYDDTKVDPASIPPPPTIPITSPFHPSHYPRPWPFTPFENPLSILLQERIPPYLLPQTLYVHDPFNLLSARERRFRDTNWMSRPDFVRTYNLKISETARIEVEEARRKAEELEEFKARTLIILRYKRTREQIENHEPAVEIPLPPYPRRVTKVDESHLYLSPVAKVGQGHHSLVYKAEWELPRDLFIRPTICRRCFRDSVDKEIQRLKDTGRWEKMLKAAAWGPTGSTGHKPTQAELDEVSEPVALEEDGEIIDREVTCLVPPDAPPSQIFELVDKESVWNMLMERRDLNTIFLNFTGPGDGDEAVKDFTVATIRLNPSFSYQSQKVCPHGPRRFAVPRTAKFTVVAKLSIENDYHLVREARNYQQFPEHLFHHYNGYTLIGQLHSLVPVNAVVPQFYGHYIPKNNQRKSRVRVPYLSPILLLEHCGEPIDPEKLSIEDQEECASLLLRFQRAGWLHESVAPRNFLVQLGKPTEFPLVRESDPETSFRLIDFGRSRRFEKAEEKRAEEVEALRMFEALKGQMNVTLAM